MKQWRNGNGYKLPGDPGFLTRLWWAIVDWRPRGDRATLGLVVFALFLLWIIIVLTTPGPV